MPRQYYVYTVIARPHRTRGRSRMPLPKTKKKVEIVARSMQDAVREFKDHHPRMTVLEAKRGPEADAPHR